MAVSRLEVRSWITHIVSFRPGLTANGLGFASGVAVLFLSRDLPPLWLPVLLVAAAGLASWRLRLLRPLAFAALGLAWAQIHACRVLCEPFPEQYTRRDLELTGSVASLPENSAEAVRFLFRVDAARHDGRGIGFDGLVRLSWYREPPPVRAGERWRLTARLKPPHGFANPGGFDYERWLFLEGVTATGSVRVSGDNRLLDPGPGGYAVNRWRQRLRDHIDRVIGAGPGGALVRALVLGDRSGLAQEQWDALTRTGTSHLIAISGLHVGLVAAFVFFLVRRAWSLSARLTLAIAAPRAAAVSAFLGALVYSGLAGFAVSTQRALIMLAVVLGALLWARTVRPAAGLTLALVGVLLLDPGAVLSYGFWLSFGAVAVLLYTFGRRLPASGIWHRWGRAQWAVALGLLPVLLLFFGRASLIAPLVNLVAVPLFSLVLLPAVLVATPLSLVPGLEGVLIWTAWVMDWGFGLLEAASAWPWAATDLSGRPAWVWLAACAGTILLLAPRGLPGRWPGLVLLLPLALVRPPLPGYGEARFTLLDVGQGLSAVVRTRSHTLIYDLGPSFASGFNTGDAVVMPFLREQGAARADLLILSHADRDHSGGFRGLRGKIPIARVLSGEPGELPEAGASPCRAGEDWTWDGVSFELLHPADGGHSGNDSSCVLRVSTPGASVLLPGDIERGIEEVLAAERRGTLRSTILVAAHHGSATSTSKVFLEAVAPRFVLYSSGFGNHFGFPAQSVRDRVASLGATELDTARLGAVEFRLAPDGLGGPITQRDRDRRLWTHVPDRSAPF